MAKDRLYINRDYRAFISSLQANNILGTDGADAKDIFELAAAIGMYGPIPADHNRDGYILTKTIKVEDKGILDAMYLGTAKETDNIDEMADFDKVIEYTEQCAEAGFAKLKEDVESAGYQNREIIEKRMINDLDDLYIKNVRGYL